MSDSLKYLIRLNQDALAFDEVPGIMFEKRHIALNDDQTGPRYRDEFIVQNTDTGKIVDFNLKNFSPMDFGLLFRAFGGVNLQTGVVTGGGFVRNPKHIVLKNPRAKAKVLLEVETGHQYVQKVA